MQPSESTPAPAPAPAPHRSKRRLAVTIGVPILILVAIAVVFMILTPRAANKLAQPSLERHSANTAREFDVQNLASAIVEFQDFNDTSPQSVATVDTDNDPATKELAVCGQNCSNASRAVTTFTKYDNTASAVQFKPYADKLTVPDTQTIYIVNKATCRNKDSLGERSSKEFDAALLYAIEATGGARQQCADL